MEKFFKLLLKIQTYSKKELINWTILKIKPKEKFLIYLIEKQHEEQICGGSISNIKDT